MSKPSFTGALLAVGALTLPVLPAAPGFAQDPGPAPVLRIDGVDVSAAHYGRWILETQASRLTKTFAEAWKIAREAEARGIVVGPEVVEAVISDEIGRRITHAFKGDEAGWQGELRRTGRTEPGYLRQRRLELIPVLQTTAMVAEGRVVPEHKIEREWELIYGPRGRDLDMLMMKFQVEVLTPPKGAPPEELERNRERAFEEQRLRALEIRERILAGEDFATLAALYSDDEATRNGAGRLGHTFRRGGWSHPFINSLLELEAGELSEPYYAQGGWWLIEMLGITDTTLEEARPAMVKHLLERGPEQDEVGTYWNELTEGLEFELNPELFNPDVVLEEGSPEPIALMIEGQPVPLSEYASWLLTMRGEVLTRHFAEQWLVERKARELGVEVSEQQVDDRCQEHLEWLINTGHKGSRESWLLYLKLSGSNVVHYMRELRDRKRVDLLVEELIIRERVVPAEDVRAQWESLYGVEGRAVSARVVLLDVAMPDVMPEGLSRDELKSLISTQVEVAESRAQDVCRRAANGEGFAALARRYSDDATTRSDGGLLPGRFRPEAWPEDVARAVLALDIGEISEPLFIGRAWAVFEVLGVQSRTFEDARADIEEELRTEQPGGGAIALYRNALVNVVEIEVLPGMTE